jgi:hypothetical protein
MTQLNLTTFTTPGFSRIIEFFGKFSFFGLTHRSDRCAGIIHNNSVEESSREILDCGGYNEAFIVQYWASYSPRY